MAYTILFIVIIARTGCDLCFKAAMNNLNFDSVGDTLPNIIKALKNPFLWGGLIFGGLNFISWIFALKFFDLSYAYPFLSICYLTIMISGKFIFKEHLDGYKLVGLGFIAAGTVALFL